jgi:hypothetical protein
MSHTIHDSHMLSNPYQSYDFANEIPDPEDLSEDLPSEIVESKPTSFEIAT